jgi:hypothetical protein
MLVRRRPHVLVLAAVAGAALGASTGPRRALAQEPEAPASSEARRHFESGRALYGHGAYREALAELQAAHTLDPSAKDLVFNLGVVEEKLGDIDEALRWFHAYTTMTLTPQERERADAYVRRLEGARAEIELGPPPAEGTVPAPAPSTADAEAPAARLAPTRGRIDAATVVAASVAGTALAAGAVLGIKALIDRPTNFVTGVDGSYQDLVNRMHTAHEEAVAADVSFAVAVAAGLAATVLYLTRTRQHGDPSPAGTARPASKDRPSATVSIVPLAGGWGLFVQGSM